MPDVRRLTYWLDGGEGVVTAIVVGMVVTKYHNKDKLPLLPATTATQAEDTYCRFGTMQIPPEIVNMIIDDFTMAEVPQTATLKACSLICRSFRSRSQMHLFSAIRCDAATRALVRFDRLLSRSPHIGPLYVRSFVLVGVNSYLRDILADSLLVSRILSQLPNLTHFEVDREADEDNEWKRQPSILKAALQKTLSLRTLRTICISEYTFSDATKLDSLLSHATALRTLSLKHIRFRHNSVRRTSSAHHEATVVLASLSVRNIDEGDIHAMLAAFSAVDMRHLLSLNVESMASMIPLLAANAQTVQKVRYCFSSATPGEQLDDPDTFAGNRSLCSIEVIEPSYDMIGTLRAFGDLSHFTMLKTISLQFNSSNHGHFDTEEWSELDAILVRAGNSLEFVNIYSSRDVHLDSAAELTALKGWLPSVAEKTSWTSR
ncbi:hypothetical protein C8J57DRAFT_1479947 [Mycena rebaudengoi]|nr:hypothetical protein C8J57DRAFT_1479947 [Mycena rebaudengoi]